MKIGNLLLTGCCSLLLFSCVSKKKLQAEQFKNNELGLTNTKLQDDLKACRDSYAALQNEKNGVDSRNASLLKQVADLTGQIDYLKQNNSQALKQLENLSVISSQQAASIKQSLDNIGAKDLYIQDLQASIAKKDSLNMALVMNLKGAIGNMADEDINIKVDKGVVYIDISDKLLFTSGKWDVTARAKEVLGKVALVLKNQPNIEFMVEGHTDNVEYKGTGLVVDNWDLSVKRATSVVKILQKQYGIEPAKMTAAGRGEYVPVSSNSTADGRAANRRTRIVILPQLDQFFKLLEQPKNGNANNG
jgi:chemotaxis protein MotB